MKPIAAVPFLVLALSAFPGRADEKRAPLRDDIPYAISLDPRMEEPVFAVCSKQGMRVLVSRDDGRTWTQTFLGTSHLEDGGWHGNFAVYGMAYTDGVIGVFSGCGAPGLYIGSDDGMEWGHLNEEGAELKSLWDATGGGGVLLTSADQWRGMSTSKADFSGWDNHRVGDLLDGGKTHHMICGYGDYEGGRFVVVGDNHHVFTSDDRGASWKHARMLDEEGRGQDALAYGNGMFLCSFETHVARSTDGGETWSLHPHGLEGRMSWRGLSFVSGQFWLTGSGGRHGRKSIDGVTWGDLPEATPGGRFVESESGTLINVERNRSDIRRSADGGATWETVFTAPEDDVSWSLAFAVFGRVNRAAE